LIFLAHSFTPIVIPHQLAGGDIKEKYMRVYIGNLGYDVTEEELQQLFSAHGQVESVSMIRDRDTNRSKGFAFVEMPSSTEAEAAIRALNEKEFHQRTLTVNEARPREERSFGGGGYRPSARDGGRETPSKRGRKPRW
jgi:cold-inducible RNA-binding protein